MAQLIKVDDTYRGNDEATLAGLGEALGLRVRATAPLQASVNAIRLGTITVARLVTRPITLVWEPRTWELQRRFLFLFVDAGVVELRGDSTRRVPDGSGLCVIAPGRAESTIEVLAGARMVLFTFDTSDIAPLAFDEQALDERPAASSIYYAAFSYLSGLALIPMESDVLGVRVLRELTCDVARSLVRALTASSQLTVTLQARADHLIEQMHRHPEFGVEDLARELGVSRRTLERAFAESAGGVAHALRATRSRHAVAALTRDPERPLREIARESGFGSVDSLRRAIHAHYSTSIAQLRAEIAGSPSENGISPILTA